MRIALCFVAALTLAACGGKKDDPAGTGSGSGSGPGTAAPPVASKLQIYVDDQLVATIDPAQVKAWPRLDTLVPVEARRLGKWEAIFLKGAKPKPSELAKPFETYRDYVPALFPGAGAAISFGMFDPVELGKRGKPALQEDGITELRIRQSAGAGRGENETGSGGGSDPSKLEIKIKTPKGESVLTGEKLLAVRREAMPGGGGDSKGWPLLTVLEAAGITTWDKLLLTDAAGLTLAIEHKDIDKNTVPFIKLNRQGSLRFRIFKKQGDGFQASGDLRALVKIEVLK